MKKTEIRYFNETGKVNTQQVLESVAKRIAEGDIHYIVVATTSGETALALRKLIPNADIKIVAVGYHAGFSGEDKLRPGLKEVEELRRNNICFVRSSHALSGVGRSISSTFGGTTPVEIIANTLRLFGGHGTKVAVEVAIMAADAGEAPTTKDIIAIGGSSRGADTALVLKPAHMNNFFDLVIREILAKPLVPKQAKLH